MIYETKPDIAAIPGAGIARSLQVLQDLGLDEELKKKHTRRKPTPLSVLRTEQNIGTVCYGFRLP